MRGSFHGAQRREMPPHPARLALLASPPSPRTRGEGKTARASCNSSRDLPGGAVLGIFQHDAHGGEFVADAVGFLEVLGLAGRGAGVDQRLTSPRTTARVGAIAADLRRRLRQETEKLCQEAPASPARLRRPDRRLAPHRQAVQRRHRARRVQIVAQRLHEPAAGAAARMRSSPTRHTSRRDLAQLSSSPLTVQSIGWR